MNKKQVILTGRLVAPLFLPAGWSHRSARAAVHGYAIIAVWSAPHGSSVSSRSLTEKPFLRP